jgi:hypothetical protein
MVKIQGIGQSAGKPEMTQEELRKLVSYNPENGEFRRLVTTARKAKAGNVGGGLDDRGYRQIWVGGKHYWAHRLAWFYMTGVWPKLVDHINGDKADTRWCNLREANKSQNAANQRQKRNRALPKGVYQYPYQYGGRPYAQIRVNNMVNTIGVYDTVMKAKAAYDAAALRGFGEFANLEPSTTIAKASTPKRAEVADTPQG